LGKFDALHIGHRELAIQASKAGPPFLLSFVGMEKVLGWEPRYDITCWYGENLKFYSCLYSESLSVNSRFRLDK